MQLFSGKFHTTCKLHLLLFLTVTCFLQSYPSRASASSQPYIGGHGINSATGNKYVQETDITVEGPVRGVTFKRTYNSQSTEVGLLGYGWSCLFSEKLIDNTTSITLVRNDGRYVKFADNGQGGYTSQLGNSQIITRVTGGFRLTKSNQDIQTYDSQGRLTSTSYRNGTGLTYAYTGDQLATITDTLGRTLAFTYTDGKLTGLATPAGSFTYAYDGNNNLASVTRPDGKSKTYLYQDAAYVHNLTGIVDESGARIQTLTYDSSDRVVTSSLADGSDAVTIAYPSLLTRTVTDSLGTVSTYELEVLNGVARVKSFTGPGCSGSCGDSTGSSYTYTSRQQVASMTDGNGAVTTYTYDGSGNQLTETEASGTALVRTTTSTYTAANELATVTEPSTSNPGQNRVTTLTYDANGNLLTRTRSGYAGTTAISEITTFTYNTLGQLTSVDGPRTDMSDTLTLAYYANEAGQGNNRGQLHTVTNPLGQTTTYSNYTPVGKPGTITDAAGLVTTLTYTFKGAVLTRTTGGLTTSYGYDDAGRVQTITLPGSRILSYTYTGDLVTAITDGLGNRINYTYDAKGQRTGEEIHDPANALTYTLSQSYDAAGNLSKRIYPGNAEETYGYDAVHNLMQTIDPTGLQTDASYDTLGRLLAVTEAGTATAGYAYDRHDNLTNVTDARGKVTASTFDDLGRQRTLTAPDTGLASSTYDAAGNLLSRTDAGNRTVSLSYDALNRPTRQSYPGAARDILFTYDQPTLGKLSALQEEESSRSFTYNSLGQLTAEARTIGAATATTSYGYNSTTGELASMTYPSGRVLTFTRDTIGRITGLQVDGAQLVSSIQYLPFGPVQGASLGSLSMTRSYDQRYQVTRIQAGGLDYTYTRDKAGQVTGVTNLPSPTTTGITETATISPDNNQLTEVSGATVKTYTHDVNGNLTSDGVSAYTWDALNRLVKVEKAGAVVATYGYDSQNRRIRKTVGAKVTHYHYDNNNLLIGEALADGTLLRDYFYLNGEPIALREYEQNPGTYFFLNDHLGTPQQLVTATGAPVWRAAYLPYGQAQIQLATVTNNLRFLGQYFDAETGLHYNLNRYYDSDTGRYLSPDPIGLQGGMNLYAYVAGDPVNEVDIWGLCRKSGEGIMDCANRQAEEAFGDLLASCDVVGFYGLGAMATEVASNLLTSAVNYVATTGMKNANSAGAYASGNILEKQVAATAGANTAGRIGALKGTLGVISKASGIVGASGTIGSVGMRAAFISDCMEECNDCSAK
jgi:RHS repeat-associated protein